jgi:hypothetical protein
LVLSALQSEQVWAIAFMALGGISLGMAVEVFVKHPPPRSVFRCFYLVNRLEGLEICSPLLNDDCVCLITWFTTVRDIPIEDPPKEKRRE